MTLVVLDPRLLVNVAKAPTGPCARLLTLLAYGRLHQYVEGSLSGAVADKEAEAERRARPQRRLTFRSSDSSPVMLGRSRDDILEHAREALERLRYGLPPQTPSTWTLAMSRELFQQMAQRVGEVRRAAPWIQAQTLHRLIASHTARYLPERWHTIPTYTGLGRARDAWIHTALRAEAAYVVTRDEALVPSRGQLVTYPRFDAPRGETSPEGRGRAQVVHFDLFVRELLVAAWSPRQTEFDLDDVDPRLLLEIAPSDANIVHL